MTDGKGRIISEVIDAALALFEFEQVIIFKININDDCDPVIQPKPLNYTQPETLSSFIYNEICIKSTRNDSTFYWSQSYEPFGQVSFPKTNSSSGGFRFKYANLSADHTELTLSMQSTENKCRMKCGEYDKQSMSPLVDKCKQCIHCVDCRYPATGGEEKVCSDELESYRSVFYWFMDICTLSLALVIAYAIIEITSSVMGKKYTHVRIILLCILLRSLLASLYEWVSTQATLIICLLSNLVDHEAFMAMIIDFSYKILYYSDNKIRTTTLTRLWIWFNYCLPAILLSHSALLESNHCSSSYLDTYFYIQVLFIIIWLVYVCQLAIGSTSADTLTISLINVCVSSLGFLALSGGLTAENRLAVMGIGWVFTTKHYMEFLRDQQINEDRVLIV